MAYDVPMKRRALFPFSLLLMMTALGCSHIPVTLHTETHVQHVDGTVEHKSSDWHGTLEVARDATADIRRRAGGSLVYLGPNNALEWQQRGAGTTAQAP